MDPDDPTFDGMLERFKKFLQDLEDRRLPSAFGYETNDQIALETNLLWVNRKNITLDKREAILITLLIEHALNVEDGSKSQFLAKRILLERIEENYDHEWRYPISLDVDRAVSSLRAKFKKHDISRNLIETKTLVGLRLSTPPWNITRLDPI